MDLNDLIIKEKTPQVMTSKFSQIGNSHCLRCDAKQTQKRFHEYVKLINSIEHFTLGEYLPTVLQKGDQPNYIESLDPEGIPVISTLTIQDMEINTEFCRFISEDEYSNISDVKKPKNNDILLTVDGGTSIGKPVLFTLNQDYAIDSHVVILRPVGIDPRALVYLLASPMGQIQFQKAESGASGQTSVTEEDIRRFVFPRLKAKDLLTIINEMDKRREEIKKIKEQLESVKMDAWVSFNNDFSSKTKKK
ncbi:MAG: hypothetical protein AB9819_04275 [Methanomassiliicoccales archaeon]